ncbi:hypothetical protein FQA39_LY01418 [Lamprigera yunnana]|nr:hypothetical protein FQA39_LY01418 [Lamprigera yunnana]
MNSQLEYLICGAFGGLCTVLVGHPLDTVKVRLQTMPIPKLHETPLYTSTFDCIRKIITKEGFFGLYKGVLAPLVSLPPIFGISFVGYSIGKSLFESASDKPLSMTQDFLAGGVAGFFSTVFTTPGERIKCLLQIQQSSKEKQYNGILDAAVKLYRKDGIRSIYKGTLITLVRDIPASGAFYLTYNQFKRYCTDDGKKDMHFLLTIIGGGLAGTMNWLVCMPADVVKSRLQTSQKATSTMVVFRQIFLQEGLLGFYRGITPVLLRAFPANGACFIGFEFCRKLLNSSVIRKKKDAVHKALDHFNDFYEDVFGVNWPSIREGLLGKQKFIAVVNNYGDKNVTINSLELLGALNMRTLFNLQKDYIQEAVAKNKRVHYLEEIWKSEEEPEVETEKETVEHVPKREFSLEASLTKANIDASRMMDETLVLNEPILSQFVPATKIKGKEDWLSETDHYKYYDKNENFLVKTESEYNLHFPEHLNVYCFEHGNLSDFESPRRGTTGVYNYYLMDGGSVLPVLALGIKPGDTILDMCAAPGGKSYVALQTLYPDCVICNDSSLSRVNRIFSVLEEYFYDLNECWIKSNRIKVTHTDGRGIERGDYDRILVDVPCTTDRLSVKENDNNIFKPARIKERLKLPEIQCDLLTNALKLVKKNGVVVYSTCSLSPIQNDGVVHMALKRIWEETNMEFVIKNLTPALAQIQSVYKLADPKLMKYGNLVVPFKSQNYGPTYFCKLQRLN